MALTIKCKAAVAYGPNQPLQIETIEVAPPGPCEVRIKIISNALCHTDLYTLTGCDPEGLFPCIVGHEAFAQVESIGSDVKSLVVGDYVIPCYTPQCHDCLFCKNEQTNLCPKVRATQGKGLMSDNTSRFKNHEGKMIYHFMGCSTLSEYSVINEISAAKVENHDGVKLSMLGCGISTGWGAVHNTCDVKPKSKVVVYGLGAVGLAVVQACKSLNCEIYGVDLNDGKFEMAMNLGCLECFNPSKLDVRKKLLELNQWGYDYTFDCTGNVNVMREALEISHRGWGQSCVIGVAASGQEISTRPFQLVTGRQWKGTAFGGWKSRDDVPKLVQKVILNELKIDDFVSNVHQGLQFVNEGFENLKKGKILRDIIQIDTSYKPKNTIQIKQVSSQKSFGGYTKQFKHQSTSCGTEMTFSVFLPQGEIKNQRKLFNTIYFLGGLTSSDENGRTKAQIQEYASKHNLAVVFPDTSPKNLGLNSDWTIGEGASYYLNAQNEKYKNFQMFDYITKELPQLIEVCFPVTQKKSIMGFSMGGHGALIAALKTQQYESVSAFAPICNLKDIEWGQCFEQYSIQDKENWTVVDLLKSCNQIPLKADMGTHDNFSKNINFDLLVEGTKNWKKSQVQYREGYDHSFYFVSTFMKEHIKFHAQYLNL